MRKQTFRPKKYFASSLFRWIKKKSISRSISKADFRISQPKRDRQHFNKIPKTHSNVAETFTREIIVIVFSGFYGRFSQSFLVIIVQKTNMRSFYLQILLKRRKFQRSFDSNKKRIYPKYSCSSFSSLLMKFFNNMTNKTRT